MSVTLTLFALRVAGGARVFACRQRAGEQHVARGCLALGAGEADVSVPAAQRLVRKSALQRASGRLRAERMQRSEVDRKTVE